MMNERRWTSDKNTRGRRCREPGTICVDAYAEEWVERAAKSGYRALVTLTVC